MRPNSKNTTVMPIIASNRMPGAPLKFPLGSDRSGKSVRVQSAITPSRCEVRAIYG
jgi:hypothetical protein